jgi:hypothetical protein
MAGMGIAMRIHRIAPAAALIGLTAFVPPADTARIHHEVELSRNSTGGQIAHRLVALAGCRRIHTAQMRQRTFPVLGWALLPLDS